MQARLLILSLALALVSLTGAAGQSARRLTAQAPATAQAGGLRGAQTETAPGMGDQSQGVPSQGLSAIPRKLGQSGLAPTGAAVINGANRSPAFSPIPAADPARDQAAETPTPQAAEDCRQACSRPYFFCLAGPDPESCAPAWTACLNLCRDPRPRSPDVPSGSPG